MMPIFFFNAGMLYGMFNITECAVDEIGGSMISAVKSPISLPHTWHVWQLVYDRPWWLLGSLRYSHNGSWSTSFRFIHSSLASPRIQTAVRRSITLHSELRISKCVRLLPVLQVPPGLSCPFASVICCALITYHTVSFLRLSIKNTRI